MESVFDRNNKERKPKIISYYENFEMVRVTQLQELVCLVCNMFNFSSNCDYDYDLILVSRNFVKTMLCYNELFSSSM